MGGMGGMGWHGWHGWHGWFGWHGGRALGRPIQWERSSIHSFAVGPSPVASSHSRLAVLTVT
eukprot:268103-Prymnesium_polylepis.1